MINKLSDLPPWGITVLGMIWGWTSITAHQGRWCQVQHLEERGEMKLTGHDDRETTTTLT